MAYSNFYSFWLSLFRSIKSSVKSIWRYRPNRWHFLIFFILFLFLVWQSYNIFTNLSGNLLVLRYRIDFGASLVGDYSRIIIYPLISLSMFVVNYVVAMFFSSSSKNRFIYNLIFTGNNVLVLFMILYLMSVYLVNFS